MQTLKDLKHDNLKDKKVILRVDFNVPLAQLPTTNYQLSTNIGLADDFRITAHKETINFLLNAGAKVALVSHIKGSFRSITEDIGKILGHETGFEEDIINPGLESQITLFENIRKYEGEEKNNKDFAEKIALNFDIYVNDAFSVCHRSHASISAVTKFLPSYVGFLLEKEVSELSKILESPAEGKVLIIGGGKVSTKVTLVKNFLDPSTELRAGAEKILIGGAVANNFFKAKGFEIGRSIVDENYVDELQPILGHPSIVIPEDMVISPDKEGKLEANPFPAGDIDPSHYILDIGPETAKHFADLILRAKMAIWNGPMGMFEVEAFAEGTKEVVYAMSKTKARTIIGGGDTISAFSKFGNLSDVDFVSTGGGAMLEFLAGSKLPGLEALHYYKV